MAARTHVTELRVRYAETDQMGVVYHTNYLIWCEVGRTDYIRSLGTSYADLERTGVALAVIELSLRCHAPARYDDPIRVETTLADVRSRTLTFDYQVLHAESKARLASARTVLMSVDRDGRAAAFPGELRARLAAALP